MIMPLTRIVAAHGNRRASHLLAGLRKEQQADLGRGQGEQGQLRRQGIADLVAGHAHQAERVRPEVGQNNQGELRRRRTSARRPAPDEPPLMPGVAELVHGQPDEGVVEPAQGVHTAGEKGHIDQRRRDHRKTTEAKPQRCHAA